MLQSHQRNQRRIIITTTEVDLNNSRKAWPFSLAAEVAIPNIIQADIRPGQKQNGKVTKDSIPLFTSGVYQFTTFLIEIYRHERTVLSLSGDRLVTEC